MELSTSASILTPLDLPWLRESGIMAEMKRDELIHPFISGNKWRKLKYNLLDARDKGYTQLLTFGGAFSNHLLATACAAASFSMRSHGIVRGEKSSLSNHVLSLCRIFGMEFSFIGREEYRMKEEYAGRNFPFSDWYHIPEGGTNEFAVQGVAELFNELNTSYDFIYTACGTGGTTAGLLHGMNAAKTDSRLRSIVVLKGGAYLLPRIEELSGGIERLDLETEYHFGGYAKCTPALAEFITEFASSSGILLDPVYTGKMMYALKDHVLSGRIPKGSRVLSIHSGGLTGLLSDRYLEYFRA